MCLSFPLIEYSRQHLLLMIIAFISSSIRDSEISSRSRRKFRGKRDAAATRMTSSEDGEINLIKLHVWHLLTSVSKEKPFEIRTFSSDQQHGRRNAADIRLKKLVWSSSNICISIMFLPNRRLFFAWDIRRLQFSRRCLSPSNRGNDYFSKTTNSIQRKLLAYGNLISFEGRRRGKNLVGCCHTLDYSIS